jgi:saccharopine dehydrogenase-like NADP-dependent oxidoreductase
MTKSILVLGAGRSSAVLIGYLAKTCAENSWSLTVGDISLPVAGAVTKGLPNVQAVQFDIQNKVESAKVISGSSIVISLLPAHLHPLVAQLCLEFGKHLVTASYVSEEMKVFHEKADGKGLLFLNECGLDPGIDHLSAMQLIDKIKSTGGEIVSFESFTGGLIAPETDPQNPWRYKFTWSSRNVVMAGQSTAKYLEDGEFKYIPYQKLFTRLTHIHVPGCGDYEGYANRDSLKYISAYGLGSVKTMLRGTLRNKGFCSAWNVFVQLGCCDDSFEIENLDTLSHQGFLRAFLPRNSGASIKSLLAGQVGLSENSKEIEMLEWVGLFSDEPVGLKKGTPAMALEHILNKKWKLSPNDKDQIVMWHRFVFDQGGKQHEIQATLVATGDDSIRTAMAKTVGLPLGIAAKLLALGKIQSRGVVIPLTLEFYDPILKELATFGIELKERSRLNEIRADLRQS